MTTSEIQTGITDMPYTINHNPVKENANRLGSSRSLSNLISIPCQNPSLSNATLATVNA